MGRVEILIENRLHQIDFFIRPECMQSRYSQ
jgi:hypothetical protein